MNQHVPPPTMTRHQFTLDDVHEMIAQGPVIVTKRTDTMKVPGQPDMPFKIIGLHVFKNGKMQEYSDYFEM